MVRVPADHGGGVPRALRGHFSLLEHCRPAKNRLHRRAELVRQGCQELVLGPVRSFGFQSPGVHIVKQSSALPVHPAPLERHVQRDVQVAL